MRSDPLTWSVRHLQEKEFKLMHYPVLAPVAPVTQDVRVAAESAARIAVAPAEATAEALITRFIAKDRT